MANEDQPEDIAAEIERAFNRISINDPDRAIRLAQLGDRLLLGFHSTGIPELLYAGIKAYGTSLTETSSESHRERCIISLILALFQRFMQEGSIDDLNETIQVCNYALGSGEHRQLVSVSLSQSLWDRINHSFQSARING
jgi:hypothetical protein